MLKTHMAACLVATMFAAPAFAQAPASPVDLRPSGSPRRACRIAERHAQQRDVRHVHDQDRKPRCSPRS